MFEDEKPRDCRNALIEENILKRSLFYKKFEKYPDLEKQSRVNIIPLHLIENPFNHCPLPNFPSQEIDVKI